MDLTSVVKGTMVMRWNVADEELEARTRSLLVTPRGDQNLCVTLPRGTEVKDFRLDPIDEGKTVGIRSVTLYEQECAGPTVYAD